jgi:hypothetical protein
MVDTDGAVLRSAADHRSTVVSSVAYGAGVLVQGEVRGTQPSLSGDDRWYQVRLLSGEVGYLYAPLVMFDGTTARDK